MKAMKTIFLQILVLLCAIAAIVGIKMLGLSLWFTYPLLAVVGVLAILCLVAAHCDRNPA